MDTQITKEVLIGAVALAAHSTLIGMWVGRLTSRINSSIGSVDELELQVAECITKSKCKAVNKQWEIKVDALLAYRDMAASQNNKEHLAFFASLDKTTDKFMGELEKSGVERDRATGHIYKKLDKISECLHKIQAEKMCD